MQYVVVGKGGGIGDVDHRVGSGNGIGQPLAGERVDARARRRSDGLVC